MHKILIEILNLLAIAAILSFPFFKTRRKGIITLGIITIQVILCSVVAVLVFMRGPIEYTYPGSWITGIIPVRIDCLSAWFMLIISFTFLTGAWYGIQYMKKYIEQENNIAMHAITFILVYTSLIDICVVQNGMMFLVIWEIMALSSFIIVIFEHYKTETLKAGINYLIQSHVGIILLTVAFMWVKVKTNSFDFQAITMYTSSNLASTGIGLFIFFFCGFAFKAGFVPFHTWLPMAHPAAPAHVSGIMSGVIIKIGIYGILRMLMLIKADMILIGYFILILSVVTGVYGVMLAIIQHNLKKLLAYHSIENIGIIGIGIGLGTLGLGYNSPILAATGFGAALLHTLNHSLFKSLLFYCAGTVYQVKHTMNIEALGGLIKKIPRSAFLFLIGSLAICGLPPFNGFVSEFFIYSGLFKGLIASQFTLMLFILFTILGLVLIGGLALICFTKAYGIVFLGKPREDMLEDLSVEKPARTIPLYFIAFLILLIGIFPGLLCPAIIKAVALFQPSVSHDNIIQFTNIFKSMTVIGWYSLAFIALTILFYYLRRLITTRRNKRIDVTWGCGYTGETGKMQYTASSFVRTYRKLAEPVLSIRKEKTTASGLYPNEVKQETHPDDKMEKWLIDSPLFFIRRFLNRFSFLQNGKLQAYILYGFIFIGLVILLPVIVDKIITLLSFLK